MLFRSYEESAPIMSRTEIEREKRKQRLLQQSKNALAQRIAQIEARILEVEDIITQYECDMADPFTYQDADRAQHVTRGHARAQEELTQLYDEWSEVSEAAEEK